jgi:hypothetical protein
MLCRTTRAILSCRLMPFMALLGGLLLLGCSRPEGAAGRRPTSPTSGTVTYKGKPVADATVSFIAIEGEPASSFGVTDAQGRFEMFTYEAGDGAVVGEHQVTITKTEGGKPIPPRTGEDPWNLETYNPPATGQMPPPVVKHLVPEKYGDAAKSGLKATVTQDGPNEFKFDLTD